VNRNQDAIDILDRVRIQISYNFDVWRMLLHAAVYLELQGRI